MTRHHLLFDALAAAVVVVAAVAIVGVGAALGGAHAPRTGGTSTTSNEEAVGEHGPVAA